MGSVGWNVSADYIVPNTAEGSAQRQINGCMDEEAKGLSRV